MQNAATVNGDVYVSIVPFVKDVNLDPSNYASNYIDWTLGTRGRRIPDALRQQFLGRQQRNLLCRELLAAAALPRKVDLLDFGL